MTIGLEDFKNNFRVRKRKTQFKQKRGIQCEKYNPPEKAKKFEVLSRSR